MKKILSIIFILALILSSFSVMFNISAEDTVVIPQGRLNPDYIYDETASQMREAILDFNNYTYSANGYYVRLDVTACNIYTTGVADFVHAFRDRYTELFFISNAFSYSYYPSNNQVAAVMLFLTDTIENVKAQIVEVLAEVNRIMTDATAIEGDVQRALYLHDYIALNTMYNENILNGTSSSAPVSIYNMYGALCQRDAVCQGYAFAYKYLLGRLGILSDIVTSYTMNHAWNVVKLGEKWYHVDITWDDPAWDIVGRINHNNFLRSDEQIKTVNHSSWEDFAVSNQNTTNYVVGTEYDNRAWINISHPILYHDGLWYYTETSGATTYIKCTENIDANTLASTQLKSLTNYWLANEQGQYWTAGRSGIAIYGNSLYYNTPTEIYKMSLDGTVDEVVFTYTQPNVYTNVYGLNINNGKAEYSILDTLSSTGKTTNNVIYQTQPLFYDRYVYNGIIYTLDNETKTAFVGNGSITDANSLEYNEIKEIVIPKTLTVGGTVYTVTGIGKNAFSESSCEKITLPETIETIFEKAFANCKSLLSLIFKGDCAVADDSSFTGTNGATVYYDGTKSGWESVSSKNLYFGIPTEDYTSNDVKVESVSPDITLNNGMIFGINQKTDVATVLGAFDGECEIYSPKGEKITDGYAGTGCVVKRFVGGMNTDEAVIVVMGDADGDSLTTLKDIVLLKKHINSAAPFDENSVQYLASDVDGDGDVDKDDLSMFISKVLG